MKTRKETAKKLANLIAYVYYATYGGKTMDVTAKDITRNFKVSNGAISLLKTMGIIKPAGNGKYAWCGPNKLTQELMNEYIMAYATNRKMEWERYVKNKSVKQTAIKFEPLENHPIYSENGNTSGLAPHPTADVLKKFTIEQLISEIIERVKKS